MIRWKDSYAVGIEMIDTQHKKLFDIAAEGEELLLLPAHMDKFDDIVKIVNDLKDYMVFHFDAEQKLMEAVKYPKFFSHRVEHQDFIEKMNELDIDTIDREQQEKLSELIKFMMDWLVGHVLENDKALAAYYIETKKQS